MSSGSLRIVIIISFQIFNENISILNRSRTLTTLPLLVNRFLNVSIYPRKLVKEFYCKGLITSRGRFENQAKSTSIFQLRIKAYF
jgi:hypothetical protein